MLKKKNYNNFFSIKARVAMLRVKYNGLCSPVWSSFKDLLCLLLPAVVVVVNPVHYFKYRIPDSFRIFISGL